MPVIDNINNSVCDDLAIEIKAGSRVSIAAACFSIYAYNELRKQLETIDELRFIFTSQAFTKEKAQKEKREFYIPRLDRERSLYGTEFEIKLRNELSQKVIAKECAEWIKSKVRFKSNITNENMGGFMNIESENAAVTYAPLNGFTTVDIGCERGNNTYNIVTKHETPNSEKYIQVFNTVWNDSNKLRDVTEDVIDSITVAYKENSPEFIYFVALYNIFNEFLEDISEDYMPNEGNGFKDSLIWNKLYSFQRDAALAIINKLEKYNGCILADSVGLGKTFTALAVIKYYENRNKSVLVLCPKKLSDNWNTFKDNYINNPIAGDRLNYKVLYHTDLSREHGYSNGTDLGRLNWGTYDLVVIDESHNFRNGGEYSGEDRTKENRYLKLLNKVIRTGVKTKVLMLSATPVNNRFYDLRNQLQLAYEGNSHILDEKLDTKKSIDDVFRNAQSMFTKWSKFPAEERTTERLLQMLDFDFFEVLDSVTIARSRKHIEKYYNTADIGTFPERLKPISISPDLTELSNAINYNQIYEILSLLNLHIYSPSMYLYNSAAEKYIDMTNNINIIGREQGIRRLMSINLLKRLESSVASFRLTVNRVKDYIDQTISEIDSYHEGADSLELTEIINPNELDYDDQNIDVISVGKKVKIDLADMDYVSWRRDLVVDSESLGKLSVMIANITPEHDSKLQELCKLIDSKIKNPINNDNKKILVFSAFSDTAEYLFENVSQYVKNRYNLNTAMITGSVDGRTTIPKFRSDMNDILTCFSPMSKDKQLLLPDTKDEIDVLIATDCISEGQNLQDCDYCVNYDIHWNPVRIIQRFGRIDRIGSKNSVIQLVNFWPNLTLDEYINLKSRVETRMKIAVATSTGDDDLINAEENGDLEYRKAQLKRLHDEVVDIEDMSSGISIMDLGLNEFRLDLLEFIKEHPEVERAPHGMEAVVASSEELPPGAIFVLRNIEGGVNIGNQNRLHPFYLVYVSENGEIVYNHLMPKDLLDRMRFLCRAKSEPLTTLCKEVNKQTKDGKDMRKYSELLGDAINSIIDVKEESDIDSLFKRGGTTALMTDISGLDDFELICFLIVR